MYRSTLSAYDHFGGALNAQKLFRSCEKKNKKPSSELFVHITVVQFTGVLSMLCLMIIVTNVQYESWEVSCSPLYYRLVTANRPYSCDVYVMCSRWIQALAVSQKPDTTRSVFTHYITMLLWPLHVLCTSSFLISASPNKRWARLSTDRRVMWNYSTPVCVLSNSVHSEHGFSSIDYWHEPRPVPTRSALVIRYSTASISLAAATGTSRRRFEPVE